MTTAGDSEFLSWAAECRLRTGDLKQKTLLESHKALGSVGFHLYSVFGWRYREVDPHLFLQLASVDLWTTFFSTVNEAVFREEVVAHLDSRELGEFTKACLDCVEPFFEGQGPYVKLRVGFTSSPTSQARWFDLLCAWRDNRDAPVDWLLMVL